MRRSWRSFRRRFIELWHNPVLNYSKTAPDTEYRFSGVFDSVSPDKTLWIRNDKLTVRVDYKNAKTYVFSSPGEENNTVFDPREVPEKIKPDRIASLTGDVKVFAGGCIVNRDGRPVFTSLPDVPLLIIFYLGSEKALSLRAVRAGRHKNEYFNFLTPYAFILGSFSQLMIAITYLSRPAYRMTLISSLIALFLPLLPWAPPGILFTIIYRRLWLQARILRSRRDQAGFHSDKSDINLNSGAAVPNPEVLKNPHLLKKYTSRALILEIVSWVCLLAGIGLNIFFIFMILALLGVHL